jgi:integrase
LRTWELEQPTISDLIGQYLEREQSIGTSHRYMLLKMSASPIGPKIAAKLRAADVIDYCKLMREEGALEPSTVLMYVTFLRGVFVAAEEAGIIGVFPDVVDEARRALQRLQVVSKSIERTRRPSAEELANLFADLRKSDAHRNSKIKMVDVMEFALASGRAREEIFNLRWGDFDQAGRTCVVHRGGSRRSKGDSGKPFPLRDDAVRIILRQRRGGNADLIFAKLGKSAGKRFIDAKKRLGITGLRFQDLRREAVMRMIEAQVPLDRIEAFTGLSLHMLERYRALRESERKQGQ